MHHHFLQTDKIRTLSIDDLRDALQVQLLVHSDADMNVVRHHTERLFRLDCQRGHEKAQKTQINRNRSLKGKREIIWIFCAF